MDLAFLDIWQPVPSCVREAYAEHAFVESGLAERADLWRLWGYLLGLALEGPIHRPRLAGALSRYM
jgi:fructosamine-3-kinase